MKKENKFSGVGKPKKKKKIEIHWAKVTHSEQGMDNVGEHYDVMLKTGKSLKLHDCNW